MNCRTCNEPGHVVHLKIDPLPGVWEFHRRPGRWRAVGETATRAHLYDGDRKVLSFAKQPDALAKVRKLAEMMNDAYRAGFLEGRFESVTQGELWGVQAKKEGA